ncbi:hypothetical protein GCG54_00011639 [Colletotrichum gloeosporioides]|uniref:Heterokaryon incompatibility domain-containing protein n=1 Tax=Colletotrichum gloeosporioides TaxID=474922 RepID=A0A8H4CHM0_COLGL|nr:uncharacterized protein GCG54_00011639 [Colletotrichum gloeosporioides]KAF3803802.1 hypothetical protein GCG54_00011639 [Colletotrichum gloeosporioides]
MDLPTPFVHRSLRHEASIRVLVLRPSPRRSAPIRCELQEISLEDAPSYEALSYVWGSPTGTHPISCDGFTMLVTPNCRDALIHLRRRVTRRILWVDAICIDQGESDRSKKERNTQVVQMGKVYQTARRVVIWLGTADQGTRGLFSRLKLVTPYDLAFVLMDEVAKLSEITEKLPKRISKAARVMTFVG